MAIQPVHNPSFAFEVLDQLPDAIIWVYPIRNSNGSVEDFEVRYSNKAADEGVNHPEGSLTGLLMLKDGVPSRESAAGNFAHFLGVFQTGEVQEFTFFAHHGNRQFETIRRPFHGGVLSTTRDRKAQREAEHKELVTRRTLQSIVDSSPNGIVVYDALRDESGRITDFRVRHYNRQINELTGFTAEERVSLSFSEVLEKLQSADQFPRYVEVVETGEALQREQYISKTGKWLSSSIVKLEDGFLALLSDITELKHSQQTLQDQSEFSNSILEASQNGIYVLEAIRGEEGQLTDFIFLTGNQQFGKLTGKPVEDYIGRRFLDLFPTTSEGLFRQFRQVLETGITHHIENYHAVAFNRWYNSTIARLGESRLVITFQEVTKQREAAMHIEQQKALLDNILKHSSNGITVGAMIRDEEGRIIDIRTVIANEAAVRFTGIPHDRYIAHTAAELDPGFVHSEYFRQCIRCMETGEPFLSQYFLEGIQRWMEVSVSRMDEEQQIYIFTDVTSVKEAQLAIERSATQLQAIINRTQSGIFTLAPVKDDQGTLTDFRFVLANRTLAHYVRQEPEALSGELGSRWFSGYKSNGLFDLFCATFETGKVNRFDFHYNDNGIDAWIDMMCTRFEDELLVTFTDYTSVKKLQLELQQLVEELKRSNQNLEEFAYAASHDLQEPLRKISTFSGRLRSELAEHLNSAQEQMFERMKSATDRMRTLIEDLLAYSQVSTRQDTSAPVQLSVVVDQVLQDLETVIAESGAVIRRDALPEIQGDERQLRQMFQNLIGNALKYRKPDRRPEVTIRCRKLDSGHPLLETQFTEAAGNFYLIEVADNGIGFEQENASKIFQVFQRLHGMAEYAGTGVGLAIVQRVVSNHRGWITAEGEPGVGATFRVLLPK
ncbi:MAG TPA: PAS domain-containing protein [Chitinophagaceae bacterium]|nr:PAS domain-containing protein [Chitinophagaceae bacterium]